MNWQSLKRYTFLPTLSLKTLPAMPRTMTTTIWKTKIAPVNLSTMASTAVSFGSAIPLHMPSLVWLPEIKNRWGVTAYRNKMYRKEVESYDLGTYKASESLGVCPEKNNENKAKVNHTSKKCVLIRSMQKLPSCHWQSRRDIEILCSVK